MAMTVRAAAPLDGEAVLSLAAAKLFLRVDGADEDALIGALRDAACDWVERYTAKSLTVRGWIATFDSFASPLRLPVGPVSGLPVIQYLDTGGAAQPLTAGWRVAGDVLVGSAWPTVTAGAGAVTVTFNAGFVTMPPGLLAAVKLTLGHLYTNRAVVVTGTIATELPFGAKVLADQHRTPVLA